MAEQATRIKDQTAGDYIATHDANEQDAAAHDRVVQIVDLGERHFDTVTTTRGSSSPITTADSVLFNSLVADLTGNLIDTGDKPTLLVMPEHTNRIGMVWITPIVWNDAEGTILALRATKASGMGDLKFYDDIVTSRWWSPQLQWDILGANKIGLHITRIYPSGNGVVLKTALI